MTILRLMLKIMHILESIEQKTFLKSECTSYKFIFKVQYQNLVIYGQCWSIHFPLFFLSLFFYCYSVKVAPIFLPLPSSAQPIPHSHSQSPHCCPCLWVIHTSSLTSLFPFFPPLSPPPSPLASVSLFHVSVDQKTVVHSHNRILHSRKKRGQFIFS